MSPLVHSTLRPLDRVDHLTIRPLTFMPVLLIAMFMPLPLVPLKLSDSCSEWITCYLNFHQSPACPTSAKTYTQEFDFYSDLWFSVFPFCLFVLLCTNFTYIWACTPKCPVLELISGYTFRVTHLDFSPTLTFDLEQQTRLHGVWPGTQAQPSCIKG